MEKSPHLLSVGQLVIEEGFRFYWDGPRAHLVSPGGDHIWLDTKFNSPTLNTEEKVINKINEVEGKMLIFAKSQNLGAQPPNHEDHRRRPLGYSFPDCYLDLVFFCGSGRLSDALHKRSETSGRTDVTVVGIDLSQGFGGDLLRSGVCDPVLATVNFGRCLGVWVPLSC